MRAPEHKVEQSLRDMFLGKKVKGIIVNGETSEVILYFENASVSIGAHPTGDESCELEIWIDGDEIWGYQL